jgi:ABC-type dipeptide/oligopeptide/nickel transport system ATPase subunit
MDSFITIVGQKKNANKTTIHTRQLKELERHLAAGKNVFVCGASGVGKSHLVRMLLDDNNSIEFTHDLASTKSAFMGRIYDSRKHIFIEDYDSSYYPYKTIIEDACEKRNPSRGSLVVTTTAMCLGYPNFEVIFLPAPKLEQLLEIRNGPDAKEAAIRSGGNIHNYLAYMDNSDDKDVFKSPKDFILDILCEDSDVKYYEHLAEHGHIWNIFQENYLDSKGVNTVEASRAFSDADIYDASIYTGNWDSMRYFALHSISIPKHALGENLIRDAIRPGSCWTKYGNYKMRMQKLRGIQRKTLGKLGVDELCLLKRYAERGDIQPMLDYDLNHQDFDVMNHLAIASKLKQRDVTHVKKALKNATTDRKDI